MFSLFSVQKPVLNIAQMPAFGHRAELNAMKCDNILTVTGAVSALDGEICLVLNPS